ncbi:Putative disease resistance protein [Glycine soja]|uniref:Putative disease resistance protein n=1 Tax=Glycine soja TaxID=3848 RepID=A0A0B2P2R9_GLYSO|nr:Putative disease resistance protein [Glycine soja]
MMQDIHEVLARGNFDKISKPSTLKEIQLVLKDPEIYMIGLYGIDGVGKTTLAKELAWQVEKDGSFDVVVMAETKEGRAEQLRQRINKQKNMLIVLDDICRVDLAELGIPYGDDHMGCKLLLTTKNLNLLKRQIAYAFRIDLTYELRNFTEMEQCDIIQLKKCHYIRLPPYDIDELPDKLDCPNLKLMSLRRNHCNLTIPNNFFSGMSGVKVLNLHGMRFVPSLPPSLCLLTSLVSLNLYGCVLEDIAIVAKLTSRPRWRLGNKELSQLWKWADQNPNDLFREVVAECTQHHLDFQSLIRHEFF